MPARSDVLYRIEREKNTVSESGKRYRPRSSRSDSKKRLIFDIDFENMDCSCGMNHARTMKSNSPGTRLVLISQFFSTLVALLSAPYAGFKMHSSHR